MRRFLNLRGLILWGLPLKKVGYLKPLRLLVKKRVGYVRPLRVEARIGRKGKD